jgi:4-hydroxy-tetrahydrodipicolinate synthase
MPFVVTEKQDLDLDGLQENIGIYEERGYHGYVLFGCMGECYAPSEEEFNKVVDVAVDATKKIACVVGTTFQNTKECLRRTKYAEDAGADGVMIGPPYLIPCTPEDVLEHYRQISDSVDEIQIMAYNNPYSFRFNMTPEFWDKLVDMDRIKAVKESSHDVLHRTMVISRIAHKINVFSGSEYWFLADSLLGANGIVSTCGQGTPRASLLLYQACMKRDLEKAIPLHKKFADLSTDVTSQNEVAWLKACSELGGIKAGPPRSPYPPLDPSLRKKLEQKIREINAMI